MLEANVVVEVESGTEAQTIGAPVTLDENPRIAGSYAYVGEERDVLITQNNNGHEGFTVPLDSVERVLTLGSRHIPRESIDAIDRRGAEVVQV